MKVLVAVKRVVDYNVKVRLNAEGQPDTATAKMSMNPFDEIASEMAVQLKEKGKATEVVAVTIGGAKAVDTLRTSMAIGADRGIHITTEENLQPLVVAKLLAKVVEKEQPAVVLLGKQAIDNDAGQVGQMLAALCDMPQATFANKLEIVSEHEALVTRDVDGGVQTVAVKLPTVVTADLRLAEPRYVTLPNMMKVETIDAATMGVDLQPRLTTISYAMPQKQKTGEILTNVSELVTKLQTEAKVL